MKRFISILLVLVLSIQLDSLWSNTKTGNENRQGKNLQIKP